MVVKHRWWWKLLFEALAKVSVHLSFKNLNFTAKITTNTVKCKTIATSVVRCQIYIGCAGDSFLIFEITVFFFNSTSHQNYGVIQWVNYE